MVNKSTIADDRLGRITWGAAQLGIAQGVLDAHADGTLGASAADELVLLVALWVDPAAHDETAVRVANRAAMRAAIADAVAARGRWTSLVARREQVGERVLRRRLTAMRIAELEVRRYARSLDPPFRAAWDPVPRDAGRGDARDRARRRRARGLRERRRRAARRGRARAAC